MEQPRITLKEKSLGCNGKLNVKLIKTSDMSYYTPKGKARLKSINKYIILMTYPNGAQVTKVMTSKVKATKWYNNESYYGGLHVV
jgi:hypothetical protein